MSDFEWDRVGHDDFESSARAPSVFLLDVDGTLIGNIAPQLCEFELLHKYDRKKLAAFKAAVVHHLRDGGLLRPDLRTFLEALRQRGGGGAEVFVYTAASDDWAKVIVPCIEQAAGVRFNRPLFTRKHCTLSFDEHHEVHYLKSIAKVVPAVLRTLQAKRNGKDAGDAVSPEGVKRNTVLLDNNPRVLLHPETEAHQVVRVPTYDMLLYYDVLARLDTGALLSNLDDVRRTLRRYGMFPVASASTSAEAGTGRLSAFYTPYFEVLAERSKRELARQQRETQARARTRLRGIDGLWYTLARLVSHKIRGRRFTPHVVKLCNRYIACDRSPYPCLDPEARAPRSADP